MRSVPCVDLCHSYIAGLVDHVRRLAPANPTTTCNPSPASSGATPQELAAGVPLPTDSAVPGLHRHFEHHFAYAAESYRYLGSESCLIKAPRLLAAPVDIPTEDDDDYQLSWKQSKAKGQELVDVYLEAVHPLYPVVDLSARYLSAAPPAKLTDTECFHLNMIYAIACHVMPSTVWKKHPEHQWNPSGRLSYQQGNAAKYRLFAASMLDEAMKYLEPATAEVSLDTLRAVLLLTIHSLFEPKNGNIGQQMALATRLAMTLESQYELQRLDPEDAQVMRNLHSTIFSIENEIASTLDRPPTFPEPVSTCLMLPHKTNGCRPGTLNSTEPDPPTICAHCTVSNTGFARVTMQPKNQSRSTCLRSMTRVFYSPVCAWPCIRPICS